MTTRDEHVQEVSEALRCLETGALCDLFKECKCQVCRAADKIEGLEADLENAIEVAYKRGAVEWTRLNYPERFAILSAPSTAGPQSNDERMATD